MVLADKRGSFLAYRFNQGILHKTDSSTETTGPLSYLFHSVHEQTHVAHVVAFAMCAGPYAGEDSCVRDARRNPTFLFENAATSAVGTPGKILIIALVFYHGSGIH